MTYENAVRHWAGRKLGIAPETIDRVVLETDTGWGDTDVTDGTPGWATVTAFLTDGSQREVIDLMTNEDGRRVMYSRRRWNMADLVREIVEAEPSGSETDGPQD